MKKQFESGHSKRKRKEAKKLAKAGSDQKQRKLSFTTMGSERYELLASKSNQKSKEREPAEELDVDQTTTASISFQGVGQNEKPRRDSTSESDVGEQVKEELIDLPSLDMHHQQSIRFPTDNALFDDLAPIDLQNKLTFLAKTKGEADVEGKPQFSSPGKKRPRESPVTHLQPYEKTIFHNFIYNFHKTESPRVNLNALRNKLMADHH
ncbi:hypothetical protein RN001_014638 [Aquatica leii]|uniref:Uncharacterized protein n=1 Tax=Aquatica leii TaxID=1421715 RepID=A0AAN7SBS2_9COLE|nr:hypothetical protein RN001_014638 [Aquatica leii]